MKLMTKELIESLPPLYSTDDVPLLEKEAVIKFFTPDASWTWYVVEGQQEEDNVVFFGYVEGLEHEWGYFDLKQLEVVRGPLNLPVERDIYFGKKKMKDIL